MRRIALSSLGLALTALPAFGQGLTWQPASERPPIAATLGTPIAATLGRPQPVVRAQMGDTPALGVPEPGQSSNYSSSVPSYNYSPYSGGYAPAPLPPADPYGSPPSKPKGDAVRRTSYSSRSHTSWYGGDGQGNVFQDWCSGVKECCTEGGRTLFQSDHCLDCFSSPVTNPFLFEDPRSLTEIRPIFMWQKIPGSNPIFQGGNAYFYGTQARIAFTDNWSFTLNKLGGVSIKPDNPALQDESGLAELHLGPKWTFYRNADCGTAAALGLIFQIPVGPSKVFQDTGDFSMVPYITAAQNFGRNSYGSFNVMDTFGYSFRIGSGRSDFLYNSIHLDFDVVNAHRFYPFLEMNWFHYTRDGSARNFGQEGQDFANIGSTGVSGNDYLTIAPGFRYKFNEHVQAGIATEFTVTTPKDINEFRLTVDMIFRY
jgi:hypothetical protein